jgi:polysaccharide export outer membrane protein
MNSCEYQPPMPCWRLTLALAVCLVLSVAPGNSKAADDAVTNGTATTPAVQPSAPAPAADATNHVTDVTNHVADATNRVNVLDDQYRLVIGDQLSYQIIEDEDDPVHLEVTDSGDLQVPYLGRYPAVGKTCKELSLALKAELEKKYYLQATVIVAVDSKPRTRGKIYLVGAIGAPGPEDISGEETLTLSKAVLRAGGLTSVADGKNVRITRNAGDHPGDETNFTVNVTRIFEKGKTENDPPLHPGDLIFVPERMVRF